ncbi:MAG: hypothetical protein PUP93_33100 [Rhizonema sp. NSF051]|nr:hypothetical protein [Rhizonema sp. NSF051]
MIVDLSYQILVGLAKHPSLLTGIPFQTVDVARKLGNPVDYTKTQRCADILGVANVL